MCIAVAVSAAYTNDVQQLLMTHKRLETWQRMLAARTSEVAEARRAHELTVVADTAHAPRSAEEIPARSHDAHLLEAAFF